MPWQIHVLLHRFFGLHPVSLSCLKKTVCSQHLSLQSITFSKNQPFVGKTPNSNPRGSYKQVMILTNNPSKDQFSRIGLTKPEESSDALPEKCNGQHPDHWRGQLSGIKHNKTEAKKHVAFLNHSPISWERSGEKNNLYDVAKFQCMAGQWDSTLIMASRKPPSS